jgi:hypothetical protein
MQAGIPRMKHAEPKRLRMTFMLRGLLKYD